MQIPVMLLYVVESHGSSPGRTGFAMAVNAKGEMHGSIGGGIMEYKFVEMTKELLQGDNTATIIRDQVHNKHSKHQSGMICSGDQKILIYRVKPTDLVTIQHILQAQDGILQLSAAGINYIQGNNPVVFFKEDDWRYEEQLGYQHQLYIIGGGHCSLALSNIMRMMDFYIHVIDTRADLHTMQQNTAAHQKTIITDYSQLDIPDDVYVVVMTMGYRTDDIVLRTLLNKRFKYWGVLGSQHKIDKMMTAYETIQDLHAPIGISINSQTPEEIAVSIAAEIIQRKNAHL